ncbi:hypothetical protein HMPREF0530_2473 [Lacticaseibacillus paracasei subsp. paracasei ATCC 25302 = DSM 5622 = JCM 8130]|nr:hypothetical protein HMPREF0530_2473 [Lacticaseibacillus paracasei subsp. paracasei ATCC 25302 = DSM 5622 = JCM 8130]
MIKLHKFQQSLLYRRLGGNAIKSCKGKMLDRQKDLQSLGSSGKVSKYF